MDRATPTPHPPARVKSLVAYVGVPSRDLEDVMQDAMIRLWERREQARSASNPGAFRDSVVLNTARDHRRAARRREEALADLDEAALCDERRSPEDHAIAREEAALVRQLIEQIGERGRVVFIACELLERPIADVAREQEIPLETARSRLRRAWEEFEEAAARWEAGQRGRGARRRRAVLFPPWLLDRRSWRPGGSARSLARGFAIACVAVLGPLLVDPKEPVEPLRTSMATVVSSSSMATVVSSRRTTKSATVQAGDPAAPARGGEALDGALTAAPALEEAVMALPALEEAVTALPALEEALTTPAALARPTGQPAAQRPEVSSRERDLIARARTAVEAGDIASLVEARRLLEEHGRRFPRGQLAGEREALLDQLR
ncbi:RNA polymerase sigma factor [Sorangium sp. So ce1151]|uniref:RNA polymerase sigma factor n=1 Tax=Sorangium sp. So ce1151 TaxID=3133332 RepID=UPI003F62B76D